MISTYIKNFSRIKKPKFTIFPGKNPNCHTWRVGYGRQPRIDMGSHFFKIFSYWVYSQIWRNFLQDGHDGNYVYISKLKHSYQSNFMPSSGELGLPLIAPYSPSARCLWGEPKAQGTYDMTLTHASQ
jgi:hypothetical protein